MAHQNDPDLLNHVLQLLTEQGHAGFAEGIRLPVNEAMRFERHQGSPSPTLRTHRRQVYANGYQPKTLTSRVDPMKPDQTKCVLFLVAIFAAPLVVLG